MEVRVGWATQFGAQKYDVSTDEVDLRRILEEAGVGEFAAQVPTTAVYRLLSLESHRFADFELLSRQTLDGERAEVVARIQAAKKERAEILAGLKERFGGLGHPGSDSD